MVKKFVWQLLENLDTYVNHGVVDWFFNLFPCENKDGSDSLSYKIWENTSRKFCEWVNIDLHDSWFPSEAEND